LSIICKNNLTSRSEKRKQANPSLFQRKPVPSAAAPKSSAATFAPSGERRKQNKQKTKKKKKHFFFKKLLGMKKPLMTEQ
jgi:hypothetical protein